MTATKQRKNAKRTREQSKEKKVSAMTDVPRKKPKRA